MTTRPLAPLSVRDLLDGPDAYFVLTEALTEFGSRQRFEAEDGFGENDESRIRWADCADALVDRIEQALSQPATSDRPAAPEGAAGPPPAPLVTYFDASGRYDGTTGARERFDELTFRELRARAIATLKARGDYDPERHGPDDSPPLDLAERLEVLALGELLARRYRHPSYVHDALIAGATWEQLADALDRQPGQLRHDYRQWADRQHQLTLDGGRLIGLDDAEHAAAIARANTEAGR